MDHAAINTKLFVSACAGLHRHGKRGCQCSGHQAGAGLSVGVARETAMSRVRSAAAPSPSTRRHVHTGWTWWMTPGWPRPPAAVLLQKLSRQHRRHLEQRSSSSTASASPAARLCRSHIVKAETLTMTPGRRATPPADRTRYVTFGRLPWSEGNKDSTLPARRGPAPSGTTLATRTARTPAPAVLSAGPESTFFGAAGRPTRHGLSQDHGQLPEELAGWHQPCG